MTKRLFIIIILFIMSSFPLIHVQTTAEHSKGTQIDGMTTFRWDGQANSVQIAGEWNGWTNATNLTFDGNHWETLLNLSEGLYCYKFIIDGIYEFDPTHNYRGYCDNIENSLIRIRDQQRPSFDIQRNDDDIIITYQPGTSGAHLVEPPSDLAGSVWNPQQNQWIVDTTTYASGKHTLTLSGTDTLGNQAYDEIVPFWSGEFADFEWQDALIYMIMTDRFINENTSNDGLQTGAASGAEWLGGDFEGVTKAISSGYFNELGVNVLWLTPFNTAAENTGKASDGYHDVSSFHGYWPVEPRGVEPRLGTEDQLKEMVDTAHQHGIRVMMDLVINHVHENHSYVQEHPTWFNNGCICGTQNCDWTEKRLECQFTSYMPDINWKNRNAAEAIVDDALWWLEEFDLDGARVDAVKHVEDHAISNLVHRIDERFEQGGTEYYLKGETAMGWSGHDLQANQWQYEAINRYMGLDGLNGQADFVLYHAVVDNVFTQANENYMHLDYWTNRSQDQYVEGSIMVPYLGSHDVPRFISRADSGTNDANNQWVEQGLPGQPGLVTPYRTAHQAFAWLLTTPGAPMMYYGDEYGEFGGADPDNRHMYRNESMWNDNELQLFGEIKALGSLRNSSIALKRGTYSTVSASPNMLHYSMSHDQQNMSIILNRGGATQIGGFDSSDEVKYGLTAIENGTLVIPEQSVTIVELGVLHNESNHTNLTNSSSYLEPGLHNFTIEQRTNGDVYNRTLLVHVPWNSTATSLHPIVFGLHWNGGTPEEFLGGWLDQLVDERGVVAVYPEGVNRSWNLGKESSQANEIEFFEDVFRFLSQFSNLDSSQRYGVGISNGAGMVHTLGGYNNSFNGIIPIVTSLTTTTLPTNTLSQPAVLQILGSDDPLVPIDGGIGVGGHDFLSGNLSTEYWANHLNCHQEAQEYILEDGSNHLFYRNCDGGKSVQGYIVNGAGHSIPPGWNGGLKAVVWEFILSVLVPQHSQEGCMDTAALNYDPSATIPGHCEYASVPVDGELTFITTDNDTYYIQFRSSSGCLYGTSIDISLSNTSDNVFNGTIELNDMFEDLVVLKIPVWMSDNWTASEEYTLVLEQSLEPGQYIIHLNDVHCLSNSSIEQEFSLNFTLEIEGCTDPIALNFHQKATVDDESCLYDTVDQTNESTASDNGSDDTPSVKICQGCCGNTYELELGQSICPSVQCEECQDAEVTSTSIQALVIPVFSIVVIIGVLTLLRRKHQN